MSSSPVTDCWSSSACRAIRSLAAASLLVVWPDGSAPAAALRQVPVLDVARVDPSTVALRWRPIPGALGYAIYRTTPPIAAPRRLADRPIADTVFFDRLPARTPATYQLVAFLTDGRTIRSAPRRLPRPSIAVPSSASCSATTGCANDCALTAP